MYSILFRDGRRIPRHGDPVRVIALVVSRCSAHAWIHHPFIQSSCCCIPIGSLPPGRAIHPPSGPIRAGFRVIRIGRRSAPRQGKSSIASGAASSGVPSHVEVRFFVSSDRVFVLSAGWTAAAVLTIRVGENGDKAEVGVVDFCGLVPDIMSSLAVASANYEADVTGGNAFAAPSSNSPSTIPTTWETAACPFQPSRPETSPEAKDRASRFRWMHGRSPACCSARSGWGS